MTSPGIHAGAGDLPPITLTASSAASGSSAASRPRPVKSPGLVGAGTSTVNEADLPGRTTLKAGRIAWRTVRKAEWTREGELLRFVIEADAFLRGMVRAIVGTLLWVGRGKIGVERFGEIVRSQDRAQAGPNAL